MVFSEKVESGLTVDKIIEKFIPVVGALCFIIGLGYLLYTSVWITLPVELKLGMGFFISLVLIGGGFSFSEKLRYFADVTIGAGILMLYGTLIYGSKTTELGANALIPEIATLVVASFVPIGTAYFASLRNSKVILALGILGSYMTPFIIGGEWGTSVLSFNSYLIYFLVANVSIFLIGREIALKDLIPLNMAGLFFGTSSLYILGFQQSNSILGNSGGIDSSLVSAGIIFILTLFSIFSIVISAKKFESKEESFLTIGYIIPLLWFMINISLLGRESIGVYGVTALYALLSVVYFVAWNYVRNMETNYQHVSLYVGGVISLVFAGLTLVPELNYISSTIIAYIGLIFAGLFFYDPRKWERFVTYITFSLFGGLLGVYYFYTEGNIETFGFVFVILTLIPGSLAYLIAQKAGAKDYIKLNEAALFSSVLCIILMLISTTFDIIESIGITFLLGILPAMILIGIATFSEKIDSNKRSTFLQLSMVFLVFGFFSKFFFLITMLVPRVADGISLLDSGSIIFNSLCALGVIFIGLHLSRKLQRERKEKRPSFLLVIFGYTTLLLFVNYLLIVGMNDLGIATGSTGGFRAIAITIWWIILAGWMMTLGLKNGVNYTSEKFLGLLLTALTLGKILLYDMSTMATDKKVIVLMIVGGILMALSYFFHTKEWFTSTKETLPENPTPPQV